jgi:hypothetical protein
MPAGTATNSTTSPRPPTGENETDNRQYRNRQHDFPQSSKGEYETDVRQYRNRQLDFHPAPTG